MSIFNNDENLQLRFYPQTKWEKHCKPFFKLLDCTDDKVFVMTMKWLKPTEGEIIFLNDDYEAIEPKFSEGGKNKFMKLLNRFADYRSVHEELKVLSNKFNPVPSDYGLFVSRYPMEVSQHYAKASKAGFYALVDPDVKIHLKNN
jgi:hypothetical protein